MSPSRYLAASAAVAGLAAAAPPYKIGTPTLSTRLAVAGVPQYVIDYAPLVYIDTQDPYFPSDIGAQLRNTHVTINNTAVTSGVPSPLTLDNLDQLNNLPNSGSGSQVYLASNEDFTKNPAYLNGVKPDANGKTNGATSAAVIIHDKGNGTVDALYAYFYAYNQGDIVLGNELGDHIGDWEHNFIRFINGKPDEIWYSEHANGEAFKYSAVEQQNNRPVSYSGRGTHANWATVGTHDHTIPDVTLPGLFLIDYTSKGPLWDPVLSAYFYNVSFPASNGPDDSSNPTFTAADSSYPVNWLYYNGQWGDDQLPDSDPRQKEFFGFKKYTGGPNGPKFKGLNRSKICPDNGNLCIVNVFRPIGS